MSTMLILENMLGAMHTLIYSSTISSPHLPIHDARCFRRLVPYLGVMFYYVWTLISIPRFKYASLTEVLNIAFDVARRIWVKGVVRYTNHWHHKLQISHGRSRHFNNIRCIQGIHIWSPRWSSLHLTKYTMLKPIIRRALSFFQSQDPTRERRAILYGLNGRD